MKRYVALLVFFWTMSMAALAQFKPNSYDTQADAAVDTRVAGIAASQIGSSTLIETGITNWFVLTNGSDSNFGTNNTAGGAFKTIKRAINAVTTGNWYSNGSAAITIQLGDGIYNENVSLKPIVGSALVIINGNSGTPANVLLAPSSGDGITANGAISGWQIQNFKIWATNGSSVVASLGASVIIGTGMNFGPAASGNYHMLANNNSAIIVSGSYSITGGAGNHYYATRGSVINDSVNPTVTLTGTPAFTAFTAADDAGVVAMFNVTFSGSATGKRFDGNLNGVIHTLGAGINYFPGNAAGTTNNGAQYQ